MAKIGLLGGTFDPPHFGHLLIAEECLEQCQLDEVWFLLSPNPPHKQNEKVTSGKIRIEMVKNAIKDNRKFVLNLIEFERDGPSYTVDTIKELARRGVNHTFYFIIGGDMIETLHEWHRINELKELVNFIGVNRPGSAIHKNELIKIKMINFPQVDISSTELRDRFKKGRNTRYLLPDSVRMYIEENHVYDE